MRTWLSITDSIARQRRARAKRRRGGSERHLHPEVDQEAIRCRAGAERRQGRDGSRRGHGRRSAQDDLRVGHERHLGGDCLSSEHHGCRRGGARVQPKHGLLAEGNGLGEPRPVLRGRGPEVGPRREMRVDLRGQRRQRLTKHTREKAPGSTPGNESRHTFVTSGAPPTVVGTRRHSGCQANVVTRGNVATPGAVGVPHSIALGAPATARAAVKSRRTVVRSRPPSAAICTSSRQNAKRKRDPGATSTSRRAARPAPGGAPRGTRSFAMRSSSVETQRPRERHGDGRRDRRRLGCGRLPPGAGAGTSRDAQAARRAPASSSAQPTKPTARALMPSPEAGLSNKHR